VAALAKRVCGYGRTTEVLYYSAGAREPGEMYDTRTQTAENSRTDEKPTTVQVSNHARFRVQQRLGVVERAAEHVRELLADAVPVDDPQYPNSRAYRCGGVTIVLDDRDDVVQTVVREVRE